MSEPNSVSEDTVRLAIARLARVYAEEIVDLDVAAVIADEATFVCLIRWRAGRLPEPDLPLCRFVRRMVDHQAIRWLRRCRRTANREGRRHRGSSGPTRA